jgi:hypothetical protein
METTFSEVKLSSTAKVMLARLQGGDLTEAQFLTECAYWSLKDGFDNIRPLSYPSRPNTQAFSEYEALSLMRRIKVDADFFYRNPEINEYYRQCKWVDNQNKAHIEWLDKLLIYLPADDVVSLEKVKNRLVAFTAQEDRVSETARAVFDVDP